MKKAILIINEQHNLLEEQKNLLSDFDVEILKVPASGWKKNGIETISKDLTQEINANGKYIIFVSPIAYLIKLLAFQSQRKVLIFHNDRREKKELPNGNIINIISKTGWELV